MKVLKENAVLVVLAVLALSVVVGALLINTGSEKIGPASDAPQGGVTIAKPTGVKNGVYYGEDLVFPVGRSKVTTGASGLIFSGPIRGSLLLTEPDTSPSSIKVGFGGQKITNGLIKKEKGATLGYLFVGSTVGYLAVSGQGSSAWSKRLISGARAR